MATKTKTDAQTQVTELLSKTKASRKEAIEKLAAEVAPKIVDACATAFCEKAPAKGSPYCAEHKPLAAAAEKKLDAMDAANTKRATKALADPRVQARLAALIAPSGMVLPSEQSTTKVLKARIEKAVHTVVAKATKAAPKRTALNQPEASHIVAALLAKGWTYKTIGRGLGGLNSGYARDWAAGKGCGRIAELKSLLLLDRPEEDVKTVSGSLKAPSEAKAAKAASLRWEDERQLVLELVSAILADKE